MARLHSRYGRRNSLVCTLIKRLTALLGICTFILLYHDTSFDQARKVPKKMQEDPRHWTNASRSHHFMGGATEIARRAVTLISRAYSPHAWITRSLGLAGELVHHLNMNFPVQTTASLGHPSHFANTKNTKPRLEYGSHGLSELKPFDVAYFMSTCLCALIQTANQLAFTSQGTFAYSCPTIPSPCTPDQVQRLWLEQRSGLP